MFGSSRPVPSSCGRCSFHLTCNDENFCSAGRWGMELEPPCKQFASEEFERPRSTGLIGEGDSSLPWRLLSPACGGDYTKRFYGHSIPLLLHFLSVLEELFPKFPCTHRVCDILQCLMQSWSTDTSTAGSPCWPQFQFGAFSFPVTIWSWSGVSMKKWCT